jgi:hypothetical protein
MGLIGDCILKDRNDFSETESTHIFLLINTSAVLKIKSETVQSG